MSSIKYIHVRPGTTYSKEGGLTGSPEPRGGYTVAYYEQGSEIVFSVAYCSPRDSYNRKLGAQIAAGRLTKGLYFIAHREDGQTAPEAILSLSD